MPAFRIAQSTGRVCYGIFDGTCHCLGFGHVTGDTQKILPPVSDLVQPVGRRATALTCGRLKGSVWSAPRQCPNLRL